MSLLVAPSLDWDSNCSRANTKYSKIPKLSPNHPIVKLLKERENYYLKADKSIEIQA